MLSNFCLFPHQTTKPNKTQKQSPALFPALTDIPGLTCSFMFFFFVGRGPLVEISKLFLQDRDQDTPSTEVCLTNKKYLKTVFLLLKWLSWILFPESFTSQIWRVIESKHQPPVSEISLQFFSSTQPAKGHLTTLGSQNLTIPSQRKPLLRKSSQFKLFLFSFLWKKEKKTDAHTTFPYFGSHFPKFYFGKYFSSHMCIESEEFFIP